MRQFIQGVVLSLALVGTSAIAFQPEFAHLMTTGFGQVTAKPDMATFSVQVSKMEDSAEAAKSAVDDVVSDFIAKLEKAGVSQSDIASSNLSLAPQYQYPKEGQPKLTGYRASRSIDVTVNQLANLNNLLDLALNAGVNQVDNITLKVRDEAKYQAQARDAAILDAKTKAAALAKGFERKLGKIWQIEYQSPTQPPVLMRGAMLNAKQENAGYQDAAIVIADQVQVIYKID
ncbi:oxidative stress defense protein [Vibrio sp. SM6]|uniref:Oxidative stress defense protein n=1 Tax=Vibrio agarilyticus TaxID=2726741 RepID=A0A7X8YGD8_9VIBR|nr:oxidative stress defense protein [Vibrio agarilyticus]NLS12863.1 oxidative stress defense protein [Vibrio agarilyticus]